MRGLGNPRRGIDNAVATTPFSFREPAEAIGALTGTPTVPVPYAVTEKAMGPPYQPSPAPAR